MIIFLIAMYVKWCSSRAHGTWVFICKRL